MEDNGNTEIVEENKKVQDGNIYTGKAVMYEKDTLYLVNR